MTMRVLCSTPPLPSSTVLAAMTICLFFCGLELKFPAAEEDDEQ
jgi:hypothetical protein